MYLAAVNIESDEFGIVTANVFYSLVCNLKRGGENVMYMYMNKYMYMYVP